MPELIFICVMVWMASVSIGIAIGNVVVYKISYAIAILSVPITFIIVQSISSAGWCLLSMSVVGIISSGVNVGCKLIGWADGYLV